MKQEHIIVGGGIAGITLAWYLSEGGHNVLLLDEGNSASRIAGGIINPLSGKRFSFKWNILSRLKALESFYASLIPYQSTALLWDKLIFRTFPNGINADTIHSQMTRESTFIPFIADILDSPPAPEFIGTAGVLIHGKQINVPATLATITEELRKRGQYKQRKIDISSLRATSHGLQVENLETQNLTLAQGWEASLGGAFAYLPFHPVKGERIIVEFQYPLSRPEISFKKYEILAPLSPTTAFMGATFTWNPLDTHPTREKKAYLTQKLTQMTNLPFEVIEHKAHIRPASCDRHPFLGQHPNLSNLFILNGLGSLGYSLAPVMSEHLMNLMTEGKQVPEEVDIKRFSSFFPSS